MFSLCVLIFLQHLIGYDIMLSFIKWKDVALRVNFFLSSKAFSKIKSCEQFLNRQSLLKLAGFHCSEFLKGFEAIFMMISCTVLSVPSGIFHSEANQILGSFQIIFLFPTKSLFSISFLRSITLPCGRQSNCEKTYADVIGFCFNDKSTSNTRPYCKCKFVEFMPFTCRLLGVILLVCSSKNLL